MELQRPAFPGGFDTNSPIAKGWKICLFWAENAHKNLESDVSRSRSSLKIRVLEVFRRRGMMVPANALQSLTEVWNWHHGSQFLLKCIAKPMRCSFIAFPLPSEKTTDGSLFESLCEEPSAVRIAIAFVHFLKSLADWFSSVTLKYRGTLQLG